MNAWGQSCQAVNQSLGTAVDAMGDLITYFQRDIEGQNRVSNNTERQINNALASLSDSLHQLAVSVSGVADAHSRAVLSFLGGRRLNREDFYILLATECVEWTNKTLGLSNFDDFELFDLLRYEGESESGYIYLASDIDDKPDFGPDDWSLEFLSKVYRTSIIAPEAIQWRKLTPKQRSFFQKYLPDAVGRFIHKREVAAQPPPTSKEPDKHPHSQPSAATRVDMAELVTALRALKVHQKARRKLNLLIRRGDRRGKLILELSGRSKYSGVLTTINCVGGWMTETLAPAASFRGFVRQPPGQETTEITFHSGRLHIGKWSCPARANNVD